jgi:hypothetical protein
MIPAGNMGESVGIRLCACSYSARIYDKTDPSQLSLEVARKQTHPGCIGCSMEYASGFALAFCIRDDKCARADRRFSLDRCF